MTIDVQLGRGTIIIITCQVVKYSLENGFLINVKE